MRVNELLTGFRQRFPECGEFELRKGESIKDAVRLNNVPNCYGVYVISKGRGARRKIFYIGKAGTLHQNGQLGKQTIRRRLTMKQDGEYRTSFFRREMEKLNLVSLHFEWFETFGNGSRTPPFLAESELLAAFYLQFNRLPDWNRKA